jgi:hypothetical protein
MSTKRDIASEVQSWIKREKARAETCRAQAADLERKAADSDRRVSCLEELLDASDFLNAPTADEVAGF